MEKFRGEIPKFLAKAKENIVYICSSNRNVEDYFYVLKDITDKKIYKFEIDGEENNLKKINYDILNLKNNKEKVIILVSLHIVLQDFFNEGLMLNIKKNEDLDLAKLKDDLIKNKYQKTYMVENKKDFSHRGDIFDIFTEDSEHPVRIEFFGDTVERLTYFDLVSQRSIENLENLSLYLVNKEQNTSFLNLLSKILKNFSLYLENEDLVLYKFEKYVLENFEIEEDLREKYNQISEQAKKIELLSFSDKELEQYEDMEEIKKLSHNYKISIFSEEIKRYQEIFKGYKINFENYPLFEGYRDKDNLILTDREIKGIRIKKYKHKKERLKYKNVKQLKENEYIIHENYGVGIYLGLENIEGKDYIKIKYADEDRLYVPIDGIGRIEKYINASGEVPSIYNLGTRGFRRKRAKLREDMLVFAKEILELQAKRELGNGFSFSKDTVWQEDFEEAFPYQETFSQQKAIQDVKRDMESTKIMDRLICGDVGFGKTEVAIRAAFKAIIDNKQVALLVPTTVLAEQHYERFSQRFKNYPINVEVLSRVKTDKEQKEVIAKMKNGLSDMLIGTHRILSDDLSFKNLGLIIIDEEQKFGVRHKEKLKKIKSGVDVLTLTATPIPRTLNMALLGIRDMSIIDSPPSGRQAISTQFIEADDNKIKEIIMNEIAREGQAFYVINRVREVTKKVDYLKNILPKYVKVDFIHGQMAARDIKRKLLDFENGIIDVLVATTIIENGIDIENANTMIIEGMDKIGLSQVYQLRGRIGRSNKKAYCYLIKKDAMGKKAKLREESLMKHSDSGGLQLSLEDMHIRGAGEILGEKQHGAIETFGYNLYVKMLTHEIEVLKGTAKKELEDVILKLNFPKFIPDSYIEGEEKLNIYTRALAIETIEEVFDMERELEDRFGKLVPEVKGFIKYIYIKNICRELNINEITEEDNNIFKIIFDEEQVCLEKIIELIEQNLIQYQRQDKSILLRGNIFDFFNKYSEKNYQKYEI